MTGLPAPEAVRRLRAVIHERVAPLLARAPRHALLEYPEYPNPGDSAIWLGTLALLDQVGVPRPVYATESRSHDPEQMEACLEGDGAVLLQGGGSFGDVWPDMQAFRESVIQATPHRPVVQLPQSLHFERTEALDATRRVLDGHPDLTILVRDAESERLARDTFRAPVARCPDLALCLDLPPAAPTAPERILWLRRTDAEAASLGAPPSPLPPTVLLRDWIQPPRTPAYRRLSARSKRLRRRPGTSAWRKGWLRRRLQKTYEPVARERLAYATSILDQGRVVITDRLHGHILCLLRRQPHVLLDNSYGKLTRFHRAWTQDVEGVRLARSVPEALAIAETLLDEAPRTDGVEYPRPTARPPRESGA